jgi:hypothetical protein
VSRCSAPAEDKINYVKDSFYEELELELECMFNRFPKT